MSPGSTDTAFEPGGATLRRVLFVALAACLLAVIPFVSGLMGSLMLFVLARGVHARLSRVLPPRVSAFVITVGVVALVLAPGAWLVSTLVTETGDAVRAWRAGDAFAWLSRSPFARYDIPTQIANASASIVAWASGRALAVFGGVTSIVLNIVIALFGLYYLLLDGAPMWRRITGLFGVSPRVATLLADKFVAVTEALLLGTVLTAALQGTVVGAGFAIFGLRPAVLWGFVTACVSVLPILGTAIVWVPGVAVLFFNHRPGAAIGLLVVGIGIASNLDNVVRLFVYRHVSNIHPMLTLVGAFAGVHVFGLVGVFVGPLALSYVAELLAVYEVAVPEGRTPAVVAETSRLEARTGP